MEASYRLLNGEEEYRQACETVIGLATQELLIFDRSLSAPKLEDKARADLLEVFLAADGHRRLRIVLHEPEQLRIRAPRLMQLFGRFSHLIEIRQTPDNLQHLADTHILADEGHGVRRFQYDQPRSALILNDPPSITPWRQRFEDLWQQSAPCLSVNSTGL